MCFSQCYSPRHTRRLNSFIYSVKTFKVSIFVELSEGQHSFFVKLHKSDYWRIQFYRGKHLKCGCFTLNRKHDHIISYIFSRTNAVDNVKHFKSNSLYSWDSVFGNLTCKTHQRIVHLSNFKNVFEEWNMSAWFSWLLSTFSPHDTFNMWQPCLRHTTDSPLPSIFSLFSVVMTVQVNVTSQMNFLLLQCIWLIRWLLKACLTAAW